jgi:hypothetical protein
MPPVLLVSESAFTPQNVHFANALRIYAGILSADTDLVLPQRIASPLVERINVSLRKKRGAEDLNARYPTKLVMRRMSMWGGRFVSAISRMDVIVLLWAFWGTRRKVCWLRRVFVGGDADDMSEVDLAFDGTMDGSGGVDVSDESFGFGEDERFCHVDFVEEDDICCCDLPVQEGKG